MVGGRKGDEKEGKREGGRGKKMEQGGKIGGREIGRR